MIVTENKTGLQYKLIGREKRIYWNNSGEPYFYYHKRRVYLDHIMRVTYPVMCYQKNKGDIDVIITGVYTISNCYGLLVEITPDCESVRLWDNALTSD